MAAGPSLNPPAEVSPLLSGKEVSVPWERFERFFGQFTHDVRNGLNALELQLTFLGEISTDPEAVEEVQRLRATLQDVTRQLQTVKAATASVVPHVLEYPADDLFEDLRERLERLHPDSASKIQWDVTLDPAFSLLVDPDPTINCLLELLTNSIQFGGTSLRCTTSNGPDGISFVLREIPEEPLTVPPEHWGEPLLTTRRGAYGLGLFRVRRFLATQGGGLTFTWKPGGHELTTAALLPRATQSARTA